MNESKTLIVATMGPSTFDKNVILDMAKHHMNIVRLNFSWGNDEWHIEIIKKIREVAQELEINLPIMQDLSGPRVQEGGSHHFGGEGDMSVITFKDIEDLSFGIEQKIDYIALSFVGSARDIIELRQLINEKGGNQKIIAKIERREAVNNLDEIIKEADGVMVARGDLGNEFPIEEIPFIQHLIIKKANMANKMVIVATQMLLSMVDKNIPTRAEVSDVAYAVLDGADGIMLSEETTVGKYPVEAVKVMERIARVAEDHQKIIKIGE
jgi:pyruvate kinase